MRTLTAFGLASFLASTALAANSVPTRCTQLTERELGKWKAPEPDPGSLDRIRLDARDFEKIRQAEEMDYAAALLEAETASKKISPGLLQVIRIRSKRTTLARPEVAKLRSAAPSDSRLSATINAGLAFASLRATLDTPNERMIALGETEQNFQFTSVARGQGFEFELDRECRILGIGLFEKAQMPVRKMTSALCGTFNRLTTRPPPWSPNDVFKLMMAVYPSDEPGSETQNKERLDRTVTQAKLCREYAEFLAPELTQSEAANAAHATPTPTDTPTAPPATPAPQPE